MVEKHLLVSVIVPVYDLERYLDRCVGSLVAQTYRELEILLVDDGSTDGSPGLCDAWAARDPRVRVIHKRNEGLGMARNTGLAAARGSCVCFVDGDDSVAPEMIGQAWQKMAETSAEVVLYGFSDVLPSGEVLRSYPPAFSRSVYRGDGVRREFLPDYVGADPKTGRRACEQCSAWSCLISMELIQRERWCFVSEREIISEDYYSMLELFRDARSVAILPKALYRYHRNEASLTRGYRPDRYDKIRVFYREYLALCRRCGYCREVERRCADPFLRLTIAALKQEAACGEAPLAGIQRILGDDSLQQALGVLQGTRLSFRKRLLHWAMARRRHRLCFLLLMGREWLARRHGG